MTASTSENSATRNPVELSMKQLELNWMEASEKSTVQLFIWRVEAHAESLMQAFFALQQHASDHTLPDLFISFLAPFETGYGYSQALANELIERYAQSDTDGDWDFASRLPCYTASDTLDLLAHFAHHHQQQLRYTVAMLSPQSVSDADALMRWIRASLVQPTPSVRLILIDTYQQPIWQPLVADYPHQVALITPPIDGMQVMQQSTSQIADSDSDRMRFRQFMADALILLARAPAAEVEQRARLALHIAEARGWPEQQVMMHNLIAGSWLKNHHSDQALAGYRQAQQAAQGVTLPALRDNLMVQSLFGTGSALLAAKEWQQAADAYRQGAVLAQQIPHPFFTIEGFRMAGYCLTQGRHLPAAIEDYARAIRAAQSLTPTERRQTSFPLALQDLLRIQDTPRAHALELEEKQYQQRKSTAILQAEVLAAQYTMQRQPLPVQQLDQQLQRTLEAHFQHIRQQREQLIQGGSQGFQQVIAIGRQYLHPHWNGLPDIAHPFDAPPGEWQSLPQFLTPIDDDALDTLMSSPIPHQPTEPT